MSPTAPRRRTAPPDPFPERGLAELGLAPGDQVRFRRSDTERWKPATVARRERDGSVGLHDPKGASRAIPVACIEVRDTGPRGGVVWEALGERAMRTEQMALVAAARDTESRRPTTRPLRTIESEAVPPEVVPSAVVPSEVVESPDREPDVPAAADGPDDDGQLRLL